MKSPSKLRSQRLSEYDLQRAANMTDYDARQQYPLCESILRIRDQCGCGSCFAFGAIEAFEDRICIHKNKNVTLSVGNIIACYDEDNLSCQGGNPITVWENIFAGPKEGQGAISESCYPYGIKPCPCNHHSPNSSLPHCPTDNTTDPTPMCDLMKQFSCSDKGLYKSQTPTLIPAAEMEAELVKNGPITVAYTVFDDFLLYSSGVDASLALYLRCIDHIVVL